MKTITYPHIKEFSDYRQYLAARYCFLRDTENFSFRKFSKLAGFGSPNYLKLVIDRERHIAPKSVAKFAIGLQLSEEETAYFKQWMFRIAEANFKDVWSKV